MGLNKATNEFMDRLADLINNSGLPPVCIRLALESARATVADLERRAVDEEIRREAEARAKAKAEAEEN